MGPPNGVDAGLRRCASLQACCNDNSDDRCDSAHILLIEGPLMEDFDKRRSQGWARVPPAFIVRGAMAAVSSPASSQIHVQPINFRTQHRPPAALRDHHLSRIRMRVHVPAQVEDPLASTGGEDASEASARRRLLNEY